MEWPILDRSSAQSSLEIIYKCQDNRQTTSKVYCVHYKLKYSKRQIRQILKNKNYTLEKLHQFELLHSLKLFTNLGCLKISLIKRLKIAFKRFRIL